jgi:hypothetical protein
MNTVTRQEDLYLKPVASQQPEQVHPAQINFADYDNNPALQRASETLGFGWNGLGDIRQLRAKPHPEDRPATQARKVREAVARFDHEWAPRMDNAKREVKTELERVNGELERAANLKANPAWYNAIVGTFQGLSPEERQKALGDIVEQADGPTLATLIEAPSLVTGLSPDQRKSLKERLFERIDPRATALRNQLTKALAKLDAASIACINDRSVLLADTDRFQPQAKEVEALQNKVSSGFATV